MNFCPKCESILYLFIQKDDEDLSQKCKNCGYIEKVDLKDNNPIYNNNINNDILDYTYEILNNKYITKDPTLPRLCNIKCINQSCLTNKRNNYLVIKNFSNLKIELFIEKLKTYLNKPDLDIQYEIIKNIDNKSIFEYGEIHTEKNFYDLDSLNKELTLIKFNINLNDVASLFEQPKLNENVILSSYINNTNEASPEINLINKQIVFIKYDSKNMKYMYICSTCGTSWKNV